MFTKLLGRVLSRIAGFELYFLEKTTADVRFPFLVPQCLYPGWGSGNVRYALASVRSHKFPIDTNQRGVLGKLYSQN